MPKTSKNEITEKEAEADKIAQGLELDEQAKNAFIELCKLGCEPEKLEGLFTRLFSKPFTVKPENRARKAYQVDFRPMDSWESALTGFDQQFLARRLKRLKIQVKKMAETISSLNATRLVRGEIEKEISDQFHCLIFGLPGALNIYAEGFIPLVLRKAKLIGPKQNPNYIAYRVKLHKHIRERTGKWRDKLVADLLNNRSSDSESRINDLSVKEWRLSHDLHD